LKQEICGLLRSGNEVVAEKCRYRSVGQKLEVGFVERVLM
jgi:hypothetical protein